MEMFGWQIGGRAWAAMWTYTAMNLPAYSVAKEAMSAAMNYSSSSHNYSGL